MRKISCKRCGGPREEGDTICPGCDEYVVTKIRWRLLPLLQFLEEPATPMPDWEHCRCR